MEDAEDEITLQEALETQEMLENQSVAVLGASDPQNCSYAKGYIKRQALYACLTCNPKRAPFFESAGICLACSYNCHEGHELVELFTKRHFRCDCGNKKFHGNPCKLQAEKDDYNADNKYNQNFSGLYCSCHRPYPDPEPEADVSDDSMIQCIICEDWLHFQHCLSHLNTDFESLENEDLELICGPCMSRLDFLGHYSHLILTPAKAPENNSAEAPTASEKQAETEKQPEGVSSGDGASSSSDDKSAVHVDTCSQDSGIDSLPGAEANLDGVAKCTMQKHPKGSIHFSNTDGVAWKGTLRTQLCRCSECMEMYKNLKIQFLVDEEDTMEHYEAMGKKLTEAAKESAEAKMNNEINRLGRVGEIELLHGYNQFKEQLVEFLKGHADSGKVVQREDVKNFFAKVNEEQAAKRRRLE